MTADYLPIRKASVWHPPDESGSPTHSIEARQLDGSLRLLEADADNTVSVPHYKLTIPAGATVDWPNDLVGYELLATTQDDEHYSETVAADHRAHPWRVVRFPRDVGGVIFPYKNQFNP